MQLTRVLSFGMVLGLVLTLAACGGKDEKKDSKKDDGGNAKENGGDAGGNTLVGKWNLDTAAMVAKMEAAAKTDEEKQQLELGKKIMAESGLPIVSADDLGDAAQKVVTAVKEAA